MPTNRPFLANFLAAFRAHSAYQQVSTTTPSVSSSAVTSSGTSANLYPSSSMGGTGPSHPTTTRSYTSKTTTTTGATTAAVQVAHGHLSHSHTHARHPSTSPVAKSPASPSPRTPGSTFGNRRRRGSDSSSEGGFKDALGNEKWYVGGRTAQGEERFYRLGMVKREKSGDRMSLDRLSL
ncbi:hypothetical protein MMC09_006653 [Bachmanniomyces sp. S44760]|nr:hypothetical protein [Bachmanniomyces sp. S44760]